MEKHQKIKEYQMRYKETEEAIIYLLEIFNFYLEKEVVLKAWVHGLVYLIVKKKVFDRDLKQTRPITLLEHARKLFTKLLTIRFNRIMVETGILNPQNNMALPHTSMASPI